MRRRHCALAPAPRPLDADRKDARRGASGGSGDGTDRRRTVGRDYESDEVFRMNCQKFENALDDLARGALMDARTRAEALAHTDSCAGCALRLADESALRTGLRALAECTADAQAPARVESALLAAFRTQAAQGVGARATAVAPGNVSSLTERAPLKQWTWVRTFATAATAAAAAAILMIIIPPGMDTQRSGSDGGNGESKTTATRQAEAPTSIAEMIEPPPVVNNLAGNDPVENLNDEPAATPGASKNIASRVTNAPRGGERMMATPVGYSSGNSGGRSARATRGPSEAATRNEEIMTNFIPLLQGGGRLVAGDGGQVVRIELPRSALERFGLPMNVERANERVKADVLLGEDGMARAIRFVR
jgi:hypothetical protein